MVNRFSTVLAGSALFVLLSVAMMFAEPGSSAMLYSSGAVTVDGVSNAATGAIFAGDTIQTADKSAARISMPGATLLIPSSSSVTYQGKSVDLESGQVEIRASNGMIAKVAGVTISPAANGTARFQIARLNGSIAISAELGSLVVNDGKSTAVVQEGTTSTVDEPQPPDPQSKKKKRKKGGAIIIGGQASGVAKTVFAGDITTAVILALWPKSPTGGQISQDHR
jgi:hypothetical protein